MFGLEKKKSDSPFFLFDLEKDLSDNEKKITLIKRIESRIISIKESLKKGSSKESFDNLGTLLNGYHALAIVLGRAVKGPAASTKQGKK